MKKMLLALVLACLMTTSAWAITSPDERLPDPALEARALELTQKLRCVVCQNESVENSHADIARDLRVLVRRQIASGQSDDQIVAFLRARYGDYILLQPPVAGRTVVLWAMPVIALGLGAVLAWPSLRRRKARR